MLNFLTLSEISWANVPSLEEDAETSDEVDADAIDYLRATRGE